MGEVPLQSLMLKRKAFIRVRAERWKNPHRGQSNGSNVNPRRDHPTHEPHNSLLGGKGDRWRTGLP